MNQNEFTSESLKTPREISENEKRQRDVEALMAIVREVFDFIKKVIMLLVEVLWPCIKSHKALKKIWHLAYHHRSWRVRKKNQKRLWGYA